MTAVLGIRRRQVDGSEKLFHEFANGKKPLFRVVFLLQLFWQVGLVKRGKGSQNRFWVTTQVEKAPMREIVRFDIPQLGPKHALDGSFCQKQGQVPPRPKLLALGRIGIGKGFRKSLGKRIDVG